MGIRQTLAGAVAALGLAAAGIAPGYAQTPSMPMSAMSADAMAGAGAGSVAGQHAAAPSAPTRRQLVDFPPELKRRTLASMRRHLQGLAGIQTALTAGDLALASRIAARTLGMGSMRGGQAHEEASYMPDGMRRLGARLHRLAGEFTLAAQDAQATGDVHTPQLLLGQMMQTCVACHAAYALK